MTQKEIRDRLFALRDGKYAAFQVRLIPNIPAESVIGVRTPALREMAKTIREDKDADDFLSSLPHTYFEENQLHAFIVSDIKNYDDCLRSVDFFLPYVDNWATCDQMSPKSFKKHKTELLGVINRWLDSNAVYTVRFAVKMLMTHYLDSDFDVSYLTRAAEIRTSEYYVNMMTAWYFATALAKKYKETIPFLEKNKLPLWVHNKTIRKATESFRISPEKKEYLRSLGR